MGAMALLLAWDWLRDAQGAADAPDQRRARLGVRHGDADAARRALHPVEATVFYWLVGAGVRRHALDRQDRRLLERLLGRRLPEGHACPPARWRNCRWLCGAFYVALGAVNLWVALHMSEADWVIFKIWIVLPAAVVFTFGLVLWTAARPVIRKEPA